MSTIIITGKYLIKVKPPQNHDFPMWSTLHLPYNHDANVECDHVHPVNAVHTREGLLCDDHSHQQEDQSVGKVSEHAPKP